MTRTRISVLIGQTPKADPTTVAQRNNLVFIKYVLLKQKRKEISVASGLLFCVIFMWYFFLIDTLYNFISCGSIWRLGGSSEVYI